MVQLGIDVITSRQGKILPLLERWINPVGKVVPQFWGDAHIQIESQRPINAGRLGAGDCRVGERALAGARLAENDDDGCTRGHGINR